MTPEVAVITRMASLAALTALVGNRIYQLKLPQTPTLPAVRVQHVDSVTEAHLRGSGALRHTRVQVDTYAREGSGSNPLASATAVAEAIEGDGGGSGSAAPSGLAGWRGTLGSPPSIRIDAILKVGSGQDYEAGELRAVRVRQDFMVHWAPI